MSAQEALALRLVGKRDRAGLEDMIAKAQAGLAALDAYDIATETADERRKRKDRERKQVRNERGTECGTDVEFGAESVRNECGIGAESVRNECGIGAESVRNFAAKWGGKGGDSLSLSGSDPLFQTGRTSKISEESKNSPPLTPPAPRSRRAVRCPAPAASEVITPELLEQVVAERWPDPFASWGALVDNYAATGKQAAGVDGWRAALRGWMRRNLDGKPPWDRAAWEAQRNLAAHRARLAAERAELPTSDDEPLIQPDLGLLEAVANKLTQGAA